MLETSKKIIEEFENKTKEEQIKWANEASLEDLEILSDYGYAFPVHDGRIADVEISVTYEGEKNDVSA